MRPVISVRHAEKVPNDWWVFDDGSGASGQSEAFTTLADSWGKTKRQVSEDMDQSLKASRVYEVEEVTQASKRKKSWWYLVTFKGYPDPEWVHGKHLEDAGTWVQGKMTEARTLGQTHSTAKVICA